jgi:hypothetical protein
MCWALSHLEGLDECPQQGSNSLCPAQQLDQPHDPEQAEEGAGDAGALIWVLWGSSPRGQSGGDPLVEGAGVGNKAGQEVQCVRVGDMSMIGGFQLHLMAHAVH